jgi:fructokinase
VSSPSHIVVGLGELIWDLLPDGKQLGGAPTNFAYISHLLGDDSVVASRIGADELGREASARLRRLGISTQYLQVDATHPTGTVGVRIDASCGEAHFAVNENSAWDYLEWTPDWERLSPRVDAVCFGTLGQRHTQARATIIRFLERTRPDALRVFDVNLRHSFFTAAMLRKSLELSTMVKLNGDELSTVAGMLELEGDSVETRCRRLMKLYDIELIAVTRGAGGSLLLTKDETVEHRGFHVEVKDTIGAGDAFAATLAHFLLRRAPLGTASEAANRIGAWIASQAGATPVADASLLKSLLRQT